MTKPKTGMDAVRENINSITQFAKDLGITRGAVNQWTEVPANRVGDVARITGLSPEVIRPDIFAQEKKT